MASQEDIADQQSLLATYRGNLKILLRQAATFGGEDAAPLHLVNGIRDARDNIQRIKGILSGWGVKVEDLPDEATPSATGVASQSPTTAKYPPAPSNILRQAGTTGPSFKYDVFISYSHADEDWVENVLLKTLEDAGLRACIDFRDFAVGRPAIINMQDAALQSRHTVLVVTQSWIKSEWTLFESLLIRTKDPTGLTQRTIPLRLQAVELPNFISMLTWVDFTRQSRHEIAWRQLFTALGASGDQGTKPSTAESAAAQSGPLPLPPELDAAARANPATDMSANNVGTTPSLREMKKQTLNRRLANLMAEYEAINQQIDGMLSEIDRIRLKRQADNLEQLISKVESDLDTL